MSQSTREDHGQSKVWNHGSARRALCGVTGLLVIGTVAAACGSSAVPSGPAKTAALVSATSNAKLGKILIDNKGFTLYHFTRDSMNKSVCTGACAKIWPPLLMTGSGSPVAGSGVTGLGTISVAGGRQVTYRGMPLHTYSGDKSAGQTHGQGVGGTWFVVTTNGSGATSTRPAGGSTSTTGGGGGGGGY